VIDRVGPNPACPLWVRWARSSVEMSNARAVQALLIAITTAGWPCGIAALCLTGKLAYQRPGSANTMV
jgi:hypothetical protein